MFSEILKIKPQLDNSDLNKMEKNLNSRFGRIAKKFGSGLVNTLKGGGAIAGILAIIDKVLNPLKEVQESIDRMLTSSDDIATNAKQFDTSTGKLAKLVQLAKASGLDQAGLFMLLNKFQNAVANAKADPQGADFKAVKNFIGEKDTADAFFQFIQALKKMDKSNQLLVQQQVFGEKQVLKMSEFLNQDFSELMKVTGLKDITSKTLGGGLDKSAKLSDLQDALRVKNETADWMTKSGLITEEMVRSKVAAEKIALDKENARLQSYKDLQAISTTVEQGVILIETAVGLLGKLINLVVPKVDALVALVSKLVNSRFIKGIFGKEGK